MSALRSQGKSPRLALVEDSGIAPPKPAPKPPLKGPRLAIATNSTLAPSKGELASLTVLNVAETLNKEPKQRSGFELHLLINLVHDKQFFSKFQSEHGDNGLKELLRRCYHE